MDDKLTAHANTIRSYATLIASLAALVGSIRACTKAADPTPAKAAFETLGPAVERLSEGQSRLYDEVSALQNYVITNGNGHAVLPVGASASAPVIGPPAASAAPAPRKPAPQKLTTKPRPWKVPDFDRMLAAYENGGGPSAPLGIEEVPVQPAAAALAVAPATAPAAFSPAGAGSAESVREPAPVGGAPSAIAPVTAPGAASAP